MLAAAVLALVPAPLTPGQVEEDFSLLRQALTEVHAGWGRYEDPGRALAAIDQAKQRAQREGTTEAVYREISRVLPLIRCDHTKAELPPDLDAKRRSERLQRPFTFRIFDGEAYIDQTDPLQPGLLKGDRIVGINGRPMARILDRLKPYVPVDGWTDDTWTVEMELSSEFLASAFDTFYPLEFGWTDEWRVTVERDAEFVTQSMKGLRYDEFAQMAGLAAAGDFDESIRYEQTGDSTGLLTIPSFINYRRNAPVNVIYGRIFDRIRADGVKKLIIDLRENGGGSDDAAIGLLSWLADRPMATSSRGAVRKFDLGRLRPHVSSWDMSVFERPDSSFERIEGGWKWERPLSGTVPQRANAFSGQVLLLSSKANASGSTMLLGFLQQRRGAVVVGEETGGSVEGPTAGTIFFLELPHSKVRVRIPLFRTYTGLEFRSGFGLKPDISAPETLASWLAGQDAALEAAKGL